MASDFYEQVFEIARMVPKGRVTSYGAIAKSLGVAKSSRLVGYAMNFSHQAVLLVPAHRVVNSKGLLTGKFHFETENTMQEQLEAEGVKVIDNKVQDFKNIFWDPILEINL